MKNDETMPELKPCPFCGGEPDLSFEHGRHPDWWKVTCVDCGNRTQTNTTHKHKAIAAWNTRADRPDPELAEVRDTLQAAKNGLQWYRDEQPNNDSGADDEMHEQIDAALAILDRKIGGA